MDFIYHKPLAFTSYSSFPWLKRNPLLFPQDGSFFPMDKTYQSAFKPVQPAAPESAATSRREEQSDDEVDIETTDEKTEEAQPAGWNLKEEKVSEKVYFWLWFVLLCFVSINEFRKTVLHYKLDISFFLIGKRLK